MTCRKVFFLAGLTLCVSLCSFSQTVTSARNGSWHDPLTWDTGVVPDSANASLIRVVHDVFIGSGEANTYSLEISGRLHIQAGAVLQVHPPSGLGSLLDAGSGRLDVDGTLAGIDGVTFSTGPTNAFFNAASTFHFRGGPKSYIPLATWDEQSTLLISGFRSSGYVGLAYSAGWRQSFGNVVYDCPLQTTFVDLNGHLRDVRGELRVRNTNSNALRLSTTQRPVVNIGKNLIVEGPSEVWFNTTGDSVRVFIGGDFIYRSSSTGPSYLATRGRTFVRTTGRVDVSSSGPLRFCSGSVDSTGIRRSTLEIHGGLHVTSGSFISPSPGRGTLTFSGAQEQVVSVPLNTFNGTFDFRFETGAVVDLGESRLGGTGDVHFRGHTKLGSVSPDGALHPLTGNINALGARYFHRGATIEYNGSAEQYIVADHPVDSTVHLVCSNSAGVQLKTPITVRNIRISGPLDAGKHEITIFGDAFVTPNGEISDAGTIRFSGGRNQVVSFDQTVADQIVVNKLPGTAVTLVSLLAIRNTLAIASAFTTLHANGFLILLSLNDDGNTATVSALPDGALITGNVTVQRYMSGEGRIYRYISSPVAEETVAGLKDDFPVTGTFLDPSTGRGLNSAGPSLYYYDESSGWIAFPAQGYASENVLAPGRGYAAYIRKQNAATIVDYTGVLNQGVMNIPVQYTPGSPDAIRGWNLIGNPYASPIDWGKADGWDRSADVSVSFAIRDNGEGRFLYSDGEIGDLESPVIASGQSFWIRTSAPDPYVVIHESAKTDSNVEFYRGKNLPSTDFLRVTLRGKGHFDHTYLRKRPHASPGLDPFDAVKMKNDFLSLSFLSDTHNTLAINAIDSFSCEGHFQLAVQYALTDSHGEYRFELLKEGLFGSTEIALHDRYQDSVAVANGYAFYVDDDPRSRDPYRFVLSIRSKPFEKPLAIMAPPRCNDANALLTLVSESDGFLYTAVDRDLTYAFISVDSLRQEALVPFENAGSDERRFVLYGQNFCTRMPVDTIVIRRPGVPAPPGIVSAVTCGDGRVSIQLKEPAKGSTFYVMNTPFDSLSSYVTRDSTFMYHSTGKSVYISAMNESGCRSDAVKVDVVRREEEPAEIVFREGVLHFSSAGIWSFEGVPLSSDSVSFIGAQKTGEYSVRSISGGCVITAAYEFDGTLDGIGIVPVPFEDRLTIFTNNSSTRVDRVVLRAVDGKILLVKEVEGGGVILFDTSDLPKGVYVAEIFSDTGRVRRKLMK